MKSANAVFKADLQRAGSLLFETNTILQQYQRLKNWNDVKIEIISKNLLSKRSSNTVQGILRAFQKRYLSSVGLPIIDCLSEYISKDIPQISKKQVLFPYIYNSDPLVKNLFEKFVIDDLNTERRAAVLTKEMLFQYFSELSKKHRALFDWSEYLKKRWIRGFLALLRDFEYLERAPGQRLKKPNLRLESFSFFAYHVVLSGKSGIDVFRSDIWAPYLLTEADVETKLIAMQSKGWIQFNKAGDIITIIPSYKTTEVWIDECLG